MRRAIPPEGMTSAPAASGKQAFKEATWVKASPTLYITNIPPGPAHLDLLEKTLRSQPGFVAPMRIAKGGAIAFGDYETPQQATDAMLNLNRLKFEGWTGEGLKISYDKDDRYARLYCEAACAMRGADKHRRQRRETPRKD